MDSGCAISRVIAASWREASTLPNCPTRQRRSHQLNGTSRRGSSLSCGPMAEPFKNLINAQTVSAAGLHLQRAWPAFDRRRFEALASAGLEALEGWNGFDAYAEKIVRESLEKWQGFRS